MEMTPAPGDIAIGAAVIGGTATRVLFVGSTGLLADDAGLTYNDTTDVLTVGGGLVVTAGQILTAAGTAAAPFLAPSADSNTGFWWGGSPTSVRLSVDGASRFNLGNTLLSMGSGITFGWSSAADVTGAAVDTSLIRAAAGVVGIGSTFRTGDGDATTPAWAFTSATNYGIIYTASTIRMSIGGTNRFIWSASNFTVNHPSATVTIGSSGTEIVLSNPAVGVLGVAGTVRSADGTVGAPAYTFTSDSNTGIYSAGADILGFSTAGAGRWTMGATNGDLVPVVNLGPSIGSASFQVNQVFCGNVTASSSFNCTGAVGTVAYGHATNVDTGMWFPSSTSIRFGIDAATVVTYSTTEATFDLPVGITDDRGLILTNQTDGAGASVGTLNNAPASSNPDFWWKVKINGTDRVIPTWNG